MEALTAVSVACLTIYDMLKAAEKGMVIDQVGCWKRPAARPGNGARREADVGRRRRW